MDEERVVNGRIKMIVLPTPERVAKGDLEIEETERGGINIRAKRQFNEPSYLYARNGLITEKQKRAGIRFYTLWNHGAFRSRYVLSKYSERQDMPTEHADVQAEVQQEYHMARKAIRGTREKEIALRVCCHSEQAGKRGQMELLRNTLDDLARHFDL